MKNQFNLSKNPIKVMENLSKTEKYQFNRFARFFKYLGKIRFVNEYDLFKKQMIIVPLIDFCIDSFLLSFLIFMILSATLISVSFTPIVTLRVAVGIALSIKLIIHIKQELWRRTE